MKDTQIPIGFLVVESRQPGDHFTDLANPRYEGVWRVPSWPPDLAQEQDAMSYYVFSPDVKDECTNVILSLERVQDVHRRLSQGGRAFEIIFCCPGADSEDLSRLGPLRWEHLGYDVAVIADGDYWSIVADFCRSDWAVPFQSKLTDHGLFDNKCDAEGYLGQYIAHNEADADSQWDIVYLVRILASADNRA